METPYKGFEINKSSFDQRFRVYEDGEAFVPVFNTDGYATLNNAKGAITKHLKTVGTEQRIAELVEQVRDSGMTILAPTMPITQSRNKREGRYAGKSQKVIITRNGKKVDVMLPVHVRATDICLAHAKRDL